MGDKRPSFLGKRSLVSLDEEEEVGSPSKVRRQGPMFLKKLQSVGVERREANGGM